MSKKNKIVKGENPEFITLSNGKVVDMSCCNIQEGIESLDNLLSEIVMGHFEIILKMATADGNYDRGLEVLADEVEYLVNNELIPHKISLEWILKTSVFKRFDFFLEKGRKKEPHFLDDYSRQK